MVQMQDLIHYKEVLVQLPDDESKIELPDNLEKNRNN